MSTAIEQIRSRLRAFASPARCEQLARFFKAGPGGYAEGDVFIGVYVPDIRRVAREFPAMTRAEIRALLGSAVHEERLLALLALAERFESGTAHQRRSIFHFYLRHLHRVNNWDLVDLSAPAVVGTHLAETGDTRLLDRLAASASTWERRVAIVATHAFIRRGELGPTLRIAEALLADREDLIHKAVGWMLREAGKRDEAALVRFLDAHGPAMPRTMLRYAIERLPHALRRWHMRRPAAG